MYHAFVVQCRPKDAGVNWKAGMSSLNPVPLYIQLNLPDACRESIHSWNQTAFDVNPQSMWKDWLYCVVCPVDWFIVFGFVLRCLSVYHFYVRYVFTIFQFLGFNIFHFYSFTLFLRGVAVWHNMKSAAMFWNVWSTIWMFVLFIWNPRFWANLVTISVERFIFSSFPPLCWFVWFPLLYTL